MMILMYVLIDEFMMKTTVYPVYKTISKQYKRYNLNCYHQPTCKQNDLLYPVTNIQAE